MNCIKNQIRGSEIGSYVGGDVHIENINLVISPAGDGKEEFSTGEYSKVFRDKKQYFIDKWNADLFLHHSGSGRELTLRQVFIFPEYKIMGQQYDDLGQRLEDFRESDDRSMLLLGTPGMGKTSIIACLAQRHRDDGNMLFLKFRDLGTDLTDGENLLTSVCRIMGCRGSDLSGKMLIIDGFDEWRPAGDKNRLLGDFMLDTANLDGVRVLITSRHNYVDLNVSGIDQVLELQPFSEKKIRAFYRLFCGVELPEDMEIRNPEVLGIPVILYMALGIGADITEAVSKCGLYEKLFAIKGGIFDRFKAKGQKPYEDGSHPVQYAKRELKTVLQRLAFELFKGNRDSISDKEYESIVQDIMGKGGRIAYDFPVKNLLEGDGTIEFVHKSIYEYFVAEYIYGKMRDGLQSKNRETMAGICGGLLGFAELTDEIYAFLEHFISHSWGEYDWNFVYSVFLLMLKKGMTCFDSIASDVNVIVREKRIFGNMLKIIHLNHGSEPELVGFKRSGFERSGFKRRGFSRSRPAGRSIEGGIFNRGKFERSGC